ncbi:MAG: hypothetical protein ACOYJL_04100 [Tractidigestivibacter sp.]|jgi:3-oxoacyl-ACP reductase-like protein|uniref:hypothetical protein n=1 Tax=Tractidigestivibacter sp. TaxID=2847320 RepID=UPI003D901904
MADESENDAASEKAIAALVEGLSSRSRRTRQEMSHQLAAVAKANPSALCDYVDQLVDALDRPEAQTRWEVLDALSEMADEYPDQVAGAFDGAEASLFDDDSATVRLAAFLFLCRVGATSEQRSDAAWSLLDEAVQCYHGDAEYRDMLAGLLAFANGTISKKTAKSLVDRMSFDAEHGNGYTKEYSEQIVAAAKPKTK